MTAPFEITRFQKVGGPLTKRIWLNDVGKLVSDGSACIMSNGWAGRCRLSGVAELAELIGSLPSNEAITLGALREGLPNLVWVVAKHRLTSEPDVIARTGEFINFRPGAPAVTLIDFDTKGMPAEVYAKLNELGGFWPALVSVVPALADAARVVRSSTSAGLSRTDTGEAMAGSNGVHVYLLVQDGTDGERFLRTLHARCWLAGLGWLMVGAGGQFLTRSIVDRVVGSPERLVFEGPPSLLPPLAQDEVARRPIATDGMALDTVAACPPLGIVEEARLRELSAREKARLAPEAAKEKDRFIDRRAEELAQRSGIDLSRARRTIERQCRGVLRPDVVLPFDDPEFAGCTVADVLGDPARFEGATLADPVEGPEYGRSVAKIMRQADGTPWIHSFAHGRTIYKLKLDARAAKAALAQAPDEAVADEFVRLALAGDLDDAEVEDLLNLAHQRTGTGKRALASKLKAARNEQNRRNAEQQQQRRLSERRDPRPRIPVPLPDSEWLPCMKTLNEVIGACRAAEPPVRNANRRVALARGRDIPSLHVLTSGESNDDDGPTNPTANTGAADPPPAQ